MIAKMPFHNSIIPVKLTIVIFFFFCLKKQPVVGSRTKKRENKNIKWNLGYNSQVPRLTTTSTN